MYPNGTAFRKAFPSLDLSPEVQALLDNCVVDRLIVNGAKTRMRIYITSENWIGKRYIYEIEEAVSAQIFENVPMEVNVVERFRLSSQYTPKNFYRVYRKSMLLELRTVSPLLHQAFLQTTLEFEGDREIRAKITDSLVASRRKEELVGYLDKVFCERAGFYNVTVTGELVENENTDLYAADDEKIRNRVRAVLKRSAAKAEKKEGEAPKQQKLPNASEKRYRQQKAFASSDPDVILGKGIWEDPVPISELSEDPHEVIVRGEVFNVETRETRNGKIIFNVSMTDYTDSIRFKLWLLPEELKEYADVFRKGKCFLVKGMMDFDQFEKEVMIKTVYSIKKIGPFKAVRADHAAVKRVELHCHTKMSDMDAVSSAKEIIGQAKRWGMKALAITDHGVVQAFPEAHHASDEKDPDFKVIYGCEGYLVDDMVSMVSGRKDVAVEEPVVVVSIVTTGMSAVSHEIIELSAQKIVSGNLTDSMTTLINPGNPLPFSFTRETGIRMRCFPACRTFAEP